MKLLGVTRPPGRTRDRPRAPPRPRPELDRRRRAVPPRAARPAAVLPDRAPRGPRATLGGRAVPGGARGRRGRRESRARQGRRGPAGSPRPRRPASELLRHRARPVARGDTRALGLRHGRSRRAADAALPRAGRCPGPQPGVLLSGHAGRPRPRGRRAARRVARVPRGMGGAGPGPARGRRALDRGQSRCLLRHGQALATRALRRGRRPRGSPHRGERRDRGRGRGAAARRDDRRAAQGALRASCAERRRSAISWAC